MLARLTIELQDDRVSYRNASALQGVLFEKISPAYADFLHKQSMHPYSQYAVKKDGKVYWIIQTLSREAYHEIILPLMAEEFRSFYLEKINEEIEIRSKKIETIEKRQLLQEFYEAEVSDEQRLDFLTATSFRQNGKYMILPDLRLLFQNVMNRYSDSSDKIDLWDEETLEQLTEQTFISRHQIRSVVYPLEGVTVPGFIGNITIRVRGQGTMKRYVRFLLRFAEYSGIGIKTSMGMGAVEMATEERR